MLQKIALMFLTVLTSALALPFPRLKHVWQEVTLTMKMRGCVSLNQPCFEHPPALATRRWHSLDVNMLLRHMESHQDLLALLTFYCCKDLWFNAFYPLFWVSWWLPSPVVHWKLSSGCLPVRGCAWWGELALTSLVILQDAIYHAGS